MIDGVMIDIETMGAGPTAAVIQIGALMFNTRELVTPLAGRTFCEWVDLGSSIVAGGTTTASTIEWWESQGGVHPPKTAPLPIGLALAQLSGFIAEAVQQGANRVWARGPSFDIAVLEGYYQRLGQREPWRYNWARDTRTIEEVAEDLGWVRPAGCEAVHDGLADCIVQVRSLNDALKYIRKLRSVRSVLSVGK